MRAHNYTMMVTSRFYLDFRRPDTKGRGQLRIMISKNRESAMISLGIALYPKQWNNDCIVNHPDAAFLNSVISAKKGEIDRGILELSALGELAGKSVKQVVISIKKKIDPDFAEKSRQKEVIQKNERESLIGYFQGYIQKKDNKGTQTLYRDTLKKIKLFCEESNEETTGVTFNQVTKSWLESFEKFCLKTEKQNTASRHLRDIRAVFNSAIDDGLTTNYPFRRFKIRKEESFDKSFSAEELRKLFMHKCYPGGEEEAVDIFKLMFCLIGINSVDIAYANQIERGRLNYIRRKTRKPYSIKIEPEAEAIINKYGGEKYILNILERCPNYKTYFNRLAKTLRKVGKSRVDGKKSTGSAILPDICTGSARTSWATIAQEELDIPRDVISAALGHHIVDVTSTYLRTDWKKKVDQANRRVLDWVLYNKK